MAVSADNHNALSLPAFGNTQVYITCTHGQAWPLLALRKFMVSPAMCTCISPWLSIHYFHAAFIGECLELDTSHVFAPMLWDMCEHVCRHLRGVDN